MCGEIKPIDEFFRHKSHKNGRASQCKECSSVCQKIYYEANKENILIQKRAYSQANRERFRVRDKIYVEANRDKIRDYQKTYQEKNKEKIRAQVKIYGKIYYKANKEKIAIRAIEYRKRNPERNRWRDFRYLEWALRNKERADWESELSNKGGQLESHHLFPWAKYKKLRYEDGNGICLTKKEHKAYHKKWGLKFDPLGWME